jgi:hypothetical protein
MPASLPIFDIFATPSATVPDNVKDKVTMSPDITLGTAMHGTRSWLPGLEPGLGDWTLTVRAADFSAMGKAVEDILVLLEYSF